MFKDRLKELRDKAGISQYELANKLYVSRSAVAKWENGSGIPSDINLEAICKYFNVNEEWLLDRKDLKNYILKIDNINKKINAVSIIGIFISFTLFICSFVGMLETGVKPTPGASGVISIMYITSIASLLKENIIIFFIIYIFTFSVSILDIVKIVKDEFRDKLLIFNTILILISLLAFIISYFVALSMCV